MYGPVSPTFCPVICRMYSTDAGTSPSACSSTDMRQKSWSWSVYFTCARLNVLPAMQYAGTHTHAACQRTRQSHASSINIKQGPRAGGRRRLEHLALTTHVSRRASKVGRHLYPVGVHICVKVATLGTNMLSHAPRVLIIHTS